MKLFVIGDLHLSLDETVDKPMDIFGDSWTNHAEKLNNIWRENITDDDYVIIAGDISWGLTLEEAKADLDFIDNLPGKKLIFKGNHDLWWQSLSKMRSLYPESKSSILFMQNRAILLELEGKKVAVTGTRGWASPGDTEFGEHDNKIYKRELIRLEAGLKEAMKLSPDEIIAVLHYPPTNDKKQASGFTSLMEKYNVKTVYYGHLHTIDGFKRGLKGVFNGVNYELISLDYLEVKPKEVK